MNESLTSELERYKDRVRVLEYAVKDGHYEQEAYLSRELYTAISDRNRKVSEYEKHVFSQQTEMKNLKNHIDFVKKNFETLKQGSSKKYEKNISEIVDLEKEKKELENIVFKVAEQLYWSSTLSPLKNVLKPTKVFTKKLPSTSQVLKNLNNAQELLNKFDECIKSKTTLSPHQIGSWEQSDIKRAFKKDVIPFSENLKETFKLFENGFIAEVKEMKDIFEQMKDEVDQCSVAKKCFEIEKKQLLINNDRLLKENITSDIMCTYLRSLNNVDNCGKFKSLDIMLLDLQESNKSLSKLRKRFAKLKISENNKLRIQLKGMFFESQLNQHGTSVNTKLFNPPTSGTKLYSVTPLPKSKVIPKVVEKYDFLKSVNSHLTTNKLIENCIKVLAPGLLKIKTELINAYFKNNRVVHRDYLNELLVVSSTNASGSKPRSNTKNDRIPQPSSRSKKNKVEANHRKFNSSANKNNHVSYCNVNVKNVALSKNSDTICLSCNECLFSANHDACVVQYLKKMQKPIIGYGDLQMGNILILRVYYVEGLGHNLFSVVQFCDSDLEVAFRKHTCFVRNLEGVDLVSGSCGSFLYTISMADMMKYSLICLLSKASKTKYWLWHRQLSHLNFSTINQLAKQGRVKGLPKLKYNKDHLYSACQMGKNKKETHPHKPEPSTNEKLQMLHMDLVKFLRTKDEALEIIIKFLKQAQVSLNATVRYIRTDNGSEFLNHNLRYYTEDVRITHHTSTAHTPQQNSLDERRLVLNQAASTSSKPPTKNDYDLLFQPMVDEYFKSPSVVSTPISVATLPPPDTAEASSSFTSINKDAPSLTKEEPNNYKEDMEESCCIKAMQEDIHEFEWLEVWKLVPKPERAMIINLKWIFKVKLDEYGGMLKNMARLVAKGYR
ncbi:retrovirus-related pol polyprotein from transposon TNT 1-94 [Tanacetum coccineum]